MLPWRVKNLVGVVIVRHLQILPWQAAGKGQPFLPLDANPTVVDAQGNTLATWWHVRD